MLQASWQLRNQALQLAAQCARETRTPQPTSAPQTFFWNIGIEFPHWIKPWWLSIYLVWNQTSFSGLWLCSTMYPYFWQLVDFLFFWSSSLVRWPWGAKNLPINNIYWHQHYQYFNSSLRATSYVRPTGLAHTGTVHNNDDSQEHYERAGNNYNHKVWADTKTRTRCTSVWGKQCSFTWCKQTSSNLLAQRVTWEKPPRWGAGPRGDNKQSKQLHAQQKRCTAVVKEKAAASPLGHEVRRGEAQVHEAARGK